MCLVLNGVDLSKKKHSFYYGVGKYGKNGKYGNYGSYGKSQIWQIWNLASMAAMATIAASHYGNANDNSIKK